MEEIREIPKGILESARALYEISPEVLREMIEGGLGYSWTIYREVYEKP